MQKLLVTELHASDEELFEENGSPKHVLLIETEESVQIAASVRKVSQEKRQLTLARADLPSNILQTTKTAE